MVAQNMGFGSLSRTVDMETLNWKISVVVHSASETLLRLTVTMGLVGV